MARLIHPDGKEETVLPLNGKTFSWAEFDRTIGGRFCLKTTLVPSRGILVFSSMPANGPANEVAKRGGALPMYVYGPAMLCNALELGWGEKKA